MDDIVHTPNPLSSSTSSARGDTLSLVYLDLLLDPDDVDIGRTTTLVVVVDTTLTLPPDPAHHVTSRVQAQKPDRPADLPD